MSDNSKRDLMPDDSYRLLHSRLQSLPFPVYGFIGHPYDLHLSGYGGSASGFALSFRTPSSSEPLRSVNLLSAQLTSVDRRDIVDGGGFPASASAYFGSSEGSPVAHFREVVSIPHYSASSSVLTVENVPIYGLHFRAMIGPLLSRRSTYSTIAFLYCINKEVRLTVSWGGFTPYELLSLLETAVEVNGQDDVIQSFAGDLDVQSTQA